MSVLSFVLVIQNYELIPLVCSYSSIHSPYLKKKSRFMWDFVCLKTTQMPIQTFKICEPFLKVMTQLMQKQKKNRIYIFFFRKKITLLVCKIMVMKGFLNAFDIMTIRAGLRNWPLCQISFSVVQNLTFDDTGNDI